MKWLRQPAMALNPVFKEKEETDLIDTQLALSAGFQIGVYDGTESVKKFLLIVSKKNNIGNLGGLG